MRFFRVLCVLFTVAAATLATGFSPYSAKAADPVVVGIDYACTQDGLAKAIDEAATDDLNAPGLVTFDCPNPVIPFTSSIVIGTSEIAAVTIDGRNGGDPIVFDGLASDSINTNFLGVGSNGYLTVQNLTMQHGVSPGSQSGAIDVASDGNLTVDSATFIDNKAPWGGVTASRGTVTISNSRFVNNQSTNFDGGVIWSQGQLTISQSTFINNHAAISGGAIFLWGGSFSVTASTFSGNTSGSQGSTIWVRENIDPASLSWSTIIQPGGEDTPALFSVGSLELTGIILGGYGNHCSISGADDLAVSHTLTNDDSCAPDSTESWENQTLNLADSQTTTINGVEQTYFPLVDNSPALNAGGVNCDTDIIDGPDPDQIGNPRPIDGACDIGAIEGIEFYAANLCANRWNGQLSMANGNADCARSETSIRLPWDGPLDLCVNTWNGATHISQRCSRSERQFTATGNGSIAICVNRWNGALRVSNRCNRSEFPDAL